MKTDNPPPPPSLSTLKANAEDAIDYLHTAHPDTLLNLNLIRAYLDALERENERLEKENMDHAEDWAFCGLDPKSKTVEGLVLRDQNRKLKERIAELERRCQEPERGYKHAIDNIRKIINEPQPTLTFSDALRIAKGCLEETDNYPAYQLGIQTVINALEAAEKGGK